VVNGIGVALQILLPKFFAKDYGRDTLLVYGFLGAAGDFLYFTARQKGEFDNREQIKARREVDNVVEGNYDQQQKRGFSMKR
jgi:hypothetical protein